MMRDEESAHTSIIAICTGFTLPLYVLLGIELVLAANLLLPLPISRPAIALCKATKTDVGRSVFFTIFFFLVAS